MGTPAVLNNQIRPFETSSKAQIAKDSNRALKIALIKTIVKKTLIELAVSLAIAGVTCFFIATPIGMATVFIAAIATVALNIIFRSIGALAEYKIQQLQKKNDPRDQSTLKNYKFVKRITNYLAPITFAVGLDMHTRDVVLHESGHALAANLLIKNPKTKISVQPLNGGQTTWRLGSLTKLGEFFGRTNAKLIVAAAGPALSVCTSIASICASIGLRKSQPELSRYLRIAAIVSIAQHAFYALSALWASPINNGHDFLRLWAGGVHPIVSVISIVAIPILVGAGFFIYEQVKKRREQKTHQFATVSL